MGKDPGACCMSWLLYTEFALFASNTTALENSLFSFFLINQLWKYF